MFFKNSKNILFFVLFFWLFLECLSFAEYFGIKFIHTYPEGAVTYKIYKQYSLSNNCFIKVSYKEYDENDSNYQEIRIINENQYINKSIKDTFPLGKLKIKVEIWCKEKIGNEWSDPVHYNYLDDEIIVDTNVIKGDFYDEPLVLSGGIHKMGSIKAFKGISLSNTQILGENSNSGVLVDSYAIISKSNINDISFSFFDTNLEKPMESFIIKDSIFNINNGYLLLRINAKNIEITNSEFSNFLLSLDPYNFSKIFIEGNSGLFLVDKNYYFGSKQGGNITIKKNDNMIINLATYLKDSQVIITNNKIKKIVLSLPDSSNLFMTDNIIDAKNAVDIDNTISGYYSYYIYMSKGAVSLNVSNSTIEKNTIIGAKDGDTVTSMSLYIKGNKNIIKHNIICGKSALGLLISGKENTVENNKISSDDFPMTGINLESASNNIIKNNIINCGYMENSSNYTNSGIKINKASKNNKVIGNIFDNCSIGFDINSSYNSIEDCITDNEISSNEFQSYKNKIYGCFYNNKFYNNVVDSAINFIFTGLGINCGDKECINEWYVTPENKSNILGGSSIGGNYWKYISCSDMNKDGFCDSEYKFEKNGKTYIFDKYPLYLADTQIIQGPSNPVNSPWLSKKKPMKVLHLKFKNNETSEGDALLESMMFKYQGSGSKDDIEEVTLYKDKSCIFDGASLVKVSSKVFSGGTVSFSGINETVKKGKEYCFVLEYKLKDQVVASSVNKSKYSPCAIYGAEIQGEDFKIKINGDDENPSGIVKGSVNADYPAIEFVDENDMNLLVARNKKLSKALQVKLEDFVNSSCYGKWKAVYEIIKKPSGVTEDYLEACGKKGNKIEAEFNADGKAEVYFKAGDKLGEYNVSVTVEPADINPYTCPVNSSVASLTFNIYAGGMKLKASLDGSSGGDDDYVVSTFIKTIEAKNKLTVTFDLPFGASKPKSVTFSPSWTSSVTDSSEPFEAEIDMKDVGKDAKLFLKGVLEDGTEFEEEYEFYAIQLPNWVNTFNGSPYKGITWGFEDGQKEYKLTFSFPDDFIWSNPIPDDIAVIGGEEDKEGLNCAVEASYYINQTSSLAGAVEFKGEVLSKPVEANGSVKIYFDKEFKVKENPHPTGKAKVSVDFDLGSKTLASKTILVYGVPITVQVDVGGNVKVFASGRLIFHKTLKLKKVIFVPGTTITITIDASASAAFGLAKIGVKAEPEGTVKIKISYTTSDGKVTEDAFGGAFSVPVTIYGSLFWGAVSGDLGSTEFGPWKFGDEVGEAGVKTSVYAVTEFEYLRSRLHKIKKSSSNKKFYSTSDVDIDSNSNKIECFTKDTSSISSEINPEIAVKLNGNEKIITNNNLWETDPSVTFTENSRAVAVWTSNNGSKDLNELNEIFNHQDIAYSYYNGNVWSNEALIINDNLPDGVSDVSYGGAGKVMAVWVHNVSGAKEDIQNKQKYEIMYSVFDEASEAWTSAGVVPTTDFGSGDFMSKVAGIGNGKFAVVWIKDNDGKLFSKLDTMKKGSDVNDNNTDCNVYYAEYDGTSWSTPEIVTKSNTRTELMPAVGVSSAGNSVVVWVEHNQGTDRLLISKKSSGKWSEAEVLDEGEYLIEDPNVTIDSKDIVHVVYRKVSGSEEGLYEVSKSLSELTASAISITRLTVSKGSLFARAKVEGNGKVLMSWTGVNSSSTLKTAEKDTSDNSTLKKTGYVVEKYDNSTGKYKGIKLTVPVIIDKGGKFQVRAKLYKDSKLIASGLSESKEVGSGEHNFEVIFSGRDINGSELNGPYMLKEIMLEKLSPSGVIMDIDDSYITTEAWLYKEFIPSVLNMDKDIYRGDNAEIKITVYEDNDTSPKVFVSSSSSSIGKTVNLSGGNGTYTGKIAVSEIGVSDVSIITLFYLDSKGKQWKKAAMWIENPPEIFELKVKVDNYTGNNKVTGLEDGIDCPNNCYESVNKGESVSLTVITDNESEFVGWEGVNCDNTSTDCTFTMDNNTEIKAYFKEKEEKFIEDNSGDVSKEGKKVKRIMSVEKGWQLVSMPVEESYNTGEKFVDSSTIWGWTGSSWEVWSGSVSIVNLLNQYKINILSKLSTGKGYWLNSGNEYSESFEGMSYGKDKIGLSDGWNLVGCGVKLKTSEFSKAKTLWQWSGSNWKVWSPESAIMILLNKYKIEIADEIKAGEGFWVNK